jgi:hypothetical protein
MPGTVSDRDLEVLATRANEAIQAIQDATGREERSAAKLRFPRGFLVEVGRWRTHLRFVRRNSVRNNVAYTLMLNDMYVWLIRRTDLAGLARDMVVKASLAALGSIAEALLIDHFAGRMGERQRFTSRTRQLVEDGTATSAQKEDLDWLWDMRCRQHLYELTSAEFDFYRVDDQRRASRTVRELILALDQAHARSVA